MTREGYLKHKETFHAWIDGATIESMHTDSCWRIIIDPSWDRYTKYRVKPFIPKQGDKVLVRYKGCIWQERTFVDMHEGKFRCIAMNGISWSVSNGPRLSLGLNVWDDCKPFEK